MDDELVLDERALLSTWRKNSFFSGNFEDCPYFITCLYSGLRNPNWLPSLAPLLLLILEHKIEERSERGVFSGGIGMTIGMPCQPHLFICHLHLHISVVNFHTPVFGFWDALELYYFMSMDVFHFLFSFDTCFVMNLNFILKHTHVYMYRERKREDFHNFIFVIY